MNVNLLRGRLTARGQAALDLMTYPFFYLFIGVIFWLGIDYAYSSWAKLEHSSTVWGPPVWPVKLMLPISALLMLVVGLRKSVMDLMLLFGLDRADAR